LSCLSGTKNFRIFLQFAHEINLIKPPISFPYMDAFYFSIQIKLEF
jgi:hypothetical protein